MIKFLDAHGRLFEVATQEVGGIHTVLLGGIGAPLTLASLTTALISGMTFSRFSSATVSDQESLINTFGSNEPRFKGARAVENLASGNLTQSITVASAGKYQVTIGSGSAVGATAVCSNAFTGTLTGDRTNRIAIGATGAPSTAATTTLTITITGEITELWVEDVTGQANQLPSEYNAGIWGAIPLSYEGTEYIAVGSSGGDLSTALGVTHTHIFNVNLNSLVINSYMFTAGVNLYFFYINPGSINLYAGGVKVYNYTLATGVDYEIAYTVNRTADELEVFVNGVSLGLVVVTMAGVPFGQATLGNHASGGTPLHGSLTSKHFARILTPTEIADSYAGIPPANPTAIYNVDEGEGTFTADSSGNGYDGTLVNFPFLPKYFDTLNANTVLANVVTEATGANIPTSTLQGILIEGQSTNLVAYSEDFTAGWTLASTTTIDPNTAIAPDGTLTGDGLVETATTFCHMVFEYFTKTIGDNNSSIYVKRRSPTDRQWVYVQMRDDPANIYSAMVDLDTGVIVDSNKIGTTLTNEGFGSELRSDGWVRIYVKANCTTTTSGLILVGISNTATPTWDATLNTVDYQGDITKGVYIWGAGAEARAFPSSYIPTTTAAVTRAADTNSSPISETADNTIALEFVPQTDFTNLDTTDLRLFSTDDSGTDILTTLGHATLWGATMVGGGILYQVPQDVFFRDSFYRASFTAEQNGANVDVSIVLNGVEVYSATLAGTLDHSDAGEIHYGYLGTAYAFIAIPSVLTDNTHLTAAQAIELTTPRITTTAFADAFV